MLCECHISFFILPSLHFSLTLSILGRYSDLGVSANLHISFYPPYLYLLGILISVGFTVKAYKDSSKGPLRQKQLTEEFQQHYVCPHCHHFLGFQSYEVLMQNEACPYCKAKIKK